MGHVRCPPRPMDVWEFSPMLSPVKSQEHYRLSCRFKGVRVSPSHRLPWDL